MDEELSAEPVAAERHPAQGRNLIFLGDQGLRAGWSALLFLAVVAMLGTAAASLAHLLLRGRFSGHLGGAVSPWAMLAGEVAQVAVVLLATWIMARIEGRSLVAYGYAGRARLSRFLWGSLWGFVAISALVGALWKEHLLAFEAGRLHGPAVLEFGLAWLAVFVGVGVFEESLLRGYLQYTLTRGLGFWWGALLLSALFGATHIGNHGESPVGLFSAAAVGLLFCVSLWYTGSLWWAIGFHALWDWGQTFFYGTPDSGFAPSGHLLSEHAVGPLLWSGGPTGPEGSLYILPLLALLALAMWLWWRRRGPVVTPYRTDL
jgi:membrane protease YdiL (CAAX protease family)